MTEIRPFYEIRRYRVFSDRRAEFVTLMEDRVIPFMVERGMDVVASFIDDEDPDAYVWMRRFANEADRAVLYAAVYDHPHWTDELAPAVFALIDVPAAVITRAVPTPRSALA
ncbi:NIPSNAP family protein [Agreia sp.]|uniref:NIPSNAP family protein n=1 Tax=Agreia sp. TaxID=1872416 RepID=UPI0035BBCB79